ncbi:DUF2125 domain-containing protein [Rhodobacter sp. Har01]|uniref:DUF2125 domain-containing protein n=1 Tax=Rhodobacter sp. Har01 TaxID=2883999 RepID=UPI001D0669C1|nr:DUF2125 domain-containing protein [Rhodobacter sp. Har01]MCB6179171.1 DUF2125 domain-containing protein [Rhodobacter sp. Har01]
MRLLGWLGGILAVLFGGLWFGGKVAIEKGAEAWFESQAAQGMTAEKTALAVTGFPGRWDLGVTGLRLADPASGAAWQAPDLHIFAQSWRPWHLTADLPAQQTVTLPGQTVAVTGEALTATLGAAASTDLPLAEITVSGVRLDATSDAGWTLALGEFAVDLKLDPSRPPGGYRLDFDLAPLTPDPTIRAAVNAVVLPDLPAPDFPETVESAYGTLYLQYSAALDRHAAETLPQLDRIEIEIVNFAWGKLALAAKGAVEADAQGFASGRISLELTNWDRLPPLLVAGGAIQPGVGTTIGNMLKALAAQSPDPAVLALPLEMKDGRMSLGPFPLGPAPQMRTP